ncbi:hypothetical protein K469DRAFT_613203, partial [Zopfia rhizophila CBS 207.26]
CIYYIRNKILLYKDYIRTFSRVFHIIDYIKKVYLKYEFIGRKFVCYYSNYKPLDNFLKDFNKFKNHIQKVYSVKL